VDKGVDHSSRTKVNRLINFPVFAFLSLMALLFLFSSRLSHLSVPHAMLESGKAIGVAGRFVHKDALVAQTNGRRRKEMRINERRIRSWLTSSFRPARSMASVLGPGGSESYRTIATRHFISGHLPEVWSERAKSPGTSGGLTSLER
jgi:hypothetical protein